MRRNPSPDLVVQAERFVQGRWQDASIPTWAGGCVKPAPTNTPAGHRFHQQLTFLTSTTSQRAMPSMRLQATIVTFILRQRKGRRLEGDAACPQNEDLGAIHGCTEQAGTGIQIVCMSY